MTIAKLVSLQMNRNRCIYEISILISQPQNTQRCQKEWSQTTRALDGKSP